jgi:nucleoside-diphosphate-sugar epimerase
MAKQRMIVTDGTGKAGRWIVRHPVESGYDVVNVDTRLPERAECRCLTADLTTLGQTEDAFSPHSTGDRAPYEQLLGWKQRHYLR